MSFIGVYVTAKTLPIIERIPKKYNLSWNKICRSTFSPRIRFHILYSLCDWVDSSNSRQHSSEIFEIIDFDFTEEDNTLDVCRPLLQSVLRIPSPWTRGRRTWTSFPLEISKWESQSGTYHFVRLSGWNPTVTRHSSAFAWRKSTSVRGTSWRPRGSRKSRWTCFPTIRPNVSQVQFFTIDIFLKMLVQHRFKI